MDEEEHGVDTKTQSEEGDDLSAGGVEWYPHESCQTHASTHIHSHQEDATKTKSSLRANLISPSVESRQRVDNLNIFK